MPITDIIARSAKPRAKHYKISDIKGLYLYVKTNGSKLWRYKYYYLSKEKTFCIGAYPEVSLKEARDIHAEARKMVRNGIDPTQAKRDKKLQSKTETENTFEIIAKEFIENRKSGWTEKYTKEVLKRLEANILPLLGYKAINKITAPELLSVLREIEKRDALDLSHRLLQVCGQIFRYAIAIGKTDRDVAADLRGALKTRKKESFSYLRENQLPEFFSKLESYDGELQTKLGLKLLILTFVRSGELRGARWEEFDLEKAEWRIPAHRMKMKELHIVPLSKQAIAIIKELKKINGSRSFVFPSRTKPETSFVSENTLLNALYRMGYHSKATTHGFRSTASTILNEHGFRSDVIERQLAHGERNKVRASYNHAQYLKERREMMQWYADHLDKLSVNGEVVNFKLNEVI